MPFPPQYQFSNLVSEENADPNGVYWTQDEGAEDSNPGRVEGSYSVWQPDGRLMTVTYYVDGESGFVPTITYTDNYTPTFWVTSQDLYQPSLILIIILLLSE